MVLTDTEVFRRDLDVGIEQEERILKQIKEVYTDFPDNEIEELITKINKYYDKSKKQVG